MAGRQRWSSRKHEGGAAVALATLALAGCASGGGGPRDESFELGGGRVVRVTAEGGLEVEVDGRATVALAEVAAPTVRTFNPVWSGPVAIYRLERPGEEAVPLERYLGAERRGEAVALSYRSADGSRRGTLTVEPAGDEATRLRLEVEGEATSIALPLRCDASGTFHGFGEQYDGTDHRGEAFQLIVSEQGIGREGAMRIIAGDAHTTYYPMPYYVDARGFGLLVETDYPVDVDLCASDPEVAWLEVHSGEPVEALLLHGPTPADVVRELGDVVGRPALPPDWAFTGLWIGAQGGRDAVLAVADHLEAESIPATALWVQDWTGTRLNIDGGQGVQFRWRADETLYPDLGSLVDDLHGRGLRFLAYANPFVDPNLDDHFPEMDAEGLLVQAPDGSGSYVFAAPNGGSSHPDLSRPEAADYVRAALREMVEGLGMDGWMADYGEYQPLDAVLADGSDPVAAHDRFPEAWHAASREVMDEARPDGDWVVFTRSGWTGAQRVHQVHWAGDQEATWEAGDGLPTVVPALLSLGLAGEPYVTHDIGGFSGGPRTKELLLRWIELGAFTPVMRTHEGNRRFENWQWDGDEETVAHLRRFARVHEALAPELLALADEAQATSMPIVRHLMLVFPEDRATFDVDDELMVGDELLVAPVVEEGATSREVYLPPGTWYHVWTGEPHEGGRTVEVDAPVGSPPVFSLGRDRPDLRAIE